MESLTAEIVGLFVYPIKSCAPVSLTEVECGLHGLEFDRSWAIIRHSGELLTQRDDPRLSLLKPVFTNFGLSIQFADRVSAVIPADSRQALGIQGGGPGGPPVRREVDKWGKGVSSMDEGDEIADWLSDVLGYPCRLVRTNASFNDVAPISVVFEETVRAVNAKLPQQVGMDRFRPSIVLRGLPAWTESNLESFRSSDVELASERPVFRCRVVNVDQVAGTWDPVEPFAKLAALHAVGGKAVLGHYFSVRKGGTIQLGSVRTKYGISNSDASGIAAPTKISGK